MSGGATGGRADPPILVVGYGTMAAAMVEGWLAAGMPPERVTLYNPRPKPAPAGIALCTELPERIAGDVLLAFKPQLLEEVAPVLAGRAGSATTVLSVLAGVTLARLAELLPAAAHVRFMPNLACAIGKSPNALVARGLDDAGIGRVTRLATMLGSAEWLEDEKLFDLVTALAGSGPAFTYRFAEALTDAAADLGLERGQAERLVLRMMEGAAVLAARSPTGPAELAARVASKGGMTQAGLDVLDRDNALKTLLKQTLAAARDRGRELGGGTAGGQAA